MSKYLYGLSIQGIQNYIFDTNELKDIIGASEIIEEICSIDFKNKLESLKIFEAESLFLAAAGNIKYIFDDKDSALACYLDFPRIIRQKGGEITFSQAIVEINGELNSQHFNELEKRLNRNRNIPINIPDLTIINRKVYRLTGKASLENKDDFKDKTTVLKKAKSDAEILNKKLFDKNSVKFSKLLSELTNKKNKNYLAVVHSDGNGLGEKIQKILNNNDIKNKTAVLKTLSDQIEKSNIEAFQIAFEKVIDSKDAFDKNSIPIRPVLLGGDDLTFIARADIALPFMQEYLKAFEESTKFNFSNNNIKEFIEKLTATAGVVYIKDKYPFHYAVNLVESVCKYAKEKSERKYSCIQFYKVKDSFVNDYKSIINIEMHPNGFDFENGPYSIDQIQNLLKNIAYFKSEKVNRGAFRELISTMYFNKSESEFLWNRILKIQLSSLKELGITKDSKLVDYKILYDLLTLSSLSTE